MYICVRIQKEKVKNGEWRTLVSFDCRLRISHLHHPSISIPRLYIIHPSHRFCSPTFLNYSILLFIIIFRFLIDYVSGQWDTLLRSAYWWWHVTEWCRAPGLLSSRCFYSNTLVSSLPFPVLSSFSFHFLARFVSSSISLFFSPLSSLFPSPFLLALCHLSHIFPSLPFPLSHFLPSPQTQSNLGNISVLRPSQKEATGLGAAIAAGLACGIYKIGTVNLLISYSLAEGVQNWVFYIFMDDYL